MGMACRTIGNNRNACSVLVRKAERKRSLGRPRRKSMYDINVDLRELDGVLWTGLMWLRIGTRGRLL
jgi:hypothetical protein